MAPNGTLEVFFLLIQTLPTFRAERIWILRTFSFLIFWTPHFWISRSPDLQIPRFPGPQISKFPDFQVPRFPDAAGGAAAGRTLRSQLDPSPNAPRDQIRRKGPCCDYVFWICHNSPTMFGYICFKTNPTLPKHKHCRQVVINFIFAVSCPIFDRI